MIQQMITDLQTQQMLMIFSDKNKKILLMKILDSMLLFCMWLSLRFDKLDTTDRKIFDCIPDQKNKNRREMQLI
jgi:hypothetical protein